MLFRNCLLLILTLMTSWSFSSEKFYVNRLKLTSLFMEKLNQPFAFKQYEGEWLLPTRPDQIYPGSCDPATLAKDPYIEKREQLDLAISIERYRSENGPHMNFTSRTIGTNNVLIDNTMNYSIGPFMGSMFKWNKKGLAITTYCVVIYPTDVSKITSLPFEKPKSEFLLCKTAHYSYFFDPKEECIISKGNPKADYPENVDEIDTESPRCIEIGLKNPCTHFDVYVRNH